MKEVFLSLLILLLNLLSVNCFAQYTYELDKTTRFENMGAEEGLSSGYTNCMHQDKYGFIWIGTQIGLNLYDGYEVRVFIAEPRNPLSIYNNSIDDIIEEPDGTMWFCLSKGISKYDRATQTFHNYFPDTTDIINPLNIIKKMVQDGEYFWVQAGTDLLRFDKKTGRFRSFAKDSLHPAKGVYSNNVDYLFIDKSGILWAATGKTSDNLDFVLNKFDKDTETFVHFKNDPSDPESFVGRPVRSMIEDRDRNIWVATEGGGLLKIIDKEKGKFKQYAHDENDSNSIIHNNLLDVFEDSKGNIWAGGVDGFARMNKNTSQFTNYQIPHYSVDSSKSNFILGINEDEKGELWLTSIDGFFRFDPVTRILKHYLFDPENKNSISHNYIVQIMHDRSGEEWIMTHVEGINRLSHFSNSFQKIERDSDNSLSGNYILNIFGDSKGNLWIGTNGRGLNRTLLKKQGNFTDFEHYVIKTEKSRNVNSIFSIDEDREHTIWIGTYQGLYRYNAQHNDFTSFEHDPNNPSSINSGLVEVAFEDSHGIFWVGTRKGLEIMDRETGKFIHLLPDKNIPGTIASNDVRVILEDSYGELWFGGSYLSKLNRKDTSFINYFSDSVVFRDFEKAHIWNIVEDDSANLWMTTWRGGLIKLQRSDMTFVSITTDQGLPDNTIMAIEIDDRGFIWTSTTQGLSRIDPRNYSIRNYDEADGLINREFIEQSSFKDEDGWLYFGGRSGFTYFHPDSIKENKFIPPVYITLLKVAGEPKYFDKPLYELGDIELRYNENDFSFDYVALNYINSQKNQYAYMLEGYDEDWNYVGNRRTAYYTNLSPGKYTFRVKGSNNDGYWNEEGASLAVVILPPFWKTWWAFVIYALAFIVLVYLLRRNELRKINLRQALELEKVNAENLAELDKEKSKFFSNVSHEFRTPLTLILGPLDRVIERLRNEDNKTDLSIVRRSALRLQTLINQLLSLSKLESGKMKLKTRPENVVKLIRLYLQSFHSMAEGRSIKLDMESDAEEYMVYVDTIKFEKVVNNLLSNAFKFTKAGGEIKVEVCRRYLAGDDPIAQGIQISFSDNGTGIKEEDLPHVFDRFYQVDEKQMKTNLGTGIGLALTKELVELHHGTIIVKSKPGKGTTFTLFLPFGKDHLLEDEIVEASKYVMETDDDLLNDDYLFVRDVADEIKTKKDVPKNNDLPLLLIVEDNEDMRSYIKSYLTNNYNIIEAEDGKEGAEKAIEHIPDLIVSDLMMPKLDGNEMTTRLKTDERTSHIPIILLTAKASKESKLEGLETGADDFLTKPFDADELLVRINNLINQRKKLREIYGKKLSHTSSPQPADLKDTGITSMDEQFLSKAYEVAEREMLDPEFGAEKFSELMGLSRMQLHRKLTALTDQTTTEFVKIIRLNKAAILLKSKSATASEIAYDVGFNTPAYFTTCFKKHFGATPSEYADL